MTRPRLATIALLCTLFALPLLTSAQTSSSDAGELQRQIDANNAQIAALDKEIQQYQSQLTLTTQQKNTLQNKINQLNLQNKQLNAKISVTQGQIKTTQLQIQQLAGGIAQKESTIGDEQQGLAQALRALNLADQQPLAVTFFGESSVSGAWQDVDAIATINAAVQTQIGKLATDRQALAASKTQAEQKATQLQSQKQTLTTQQGSLQATKQAQSELLAQTKSQEASYQSIIAQKQKAKADFESTINALQAKLKAANTANVPVANAGILAWPLKSIRVTQYFGDTEFARTAAYNGKGHNGIDLGASIGTPVYAALDGTVWDTNLGAAPNCQYGKWILIKHPNGLATLYAHLSSIKVTPGQSVDQGTLIGYSGDTGYATGPHLHFTVYNASAVSFINYKCASGPTVRVPVSPFNGYLNPIDYLPQL